MQTVNFVEFRKHLSEFVGQACFADERIAVTYHGKVVGGFVSAQALRYLEKVEMQKDIEAFDKAMERHKKSGSKTLSHKEMLKLLDLDV